MMFGIPEGVDPATSAPALINPLPTVLEFSVAGSGNVNFFAPAAACIAAGLVCNSGEVCQCVQTLGNVTDGVGSVFHGSFSFLLSIVISRQYPNGNNVGRSCFFASGLLMVTEFPGSAINFITSGAACNGTQGGVALYSGGFGVGPSTGGFSKAVGSGVLGFGANFSTGLGIFDLKGAGTNLN
jgi:hypothetical protein